MWSGVLTSNAVDYRNRFLLFASSSPIAKPAYLMLGRPFSWLFLGLSPIYTCCVGSQASVISPSASHSLRVETALGFCGTAEYGKWQEGDRVHSLAVSYSASDRLPLQHWMCPMHGHFGNFPHSSFSDRPPVREMSPAASPALPVAMQWHVAMLHVPWQCCLSGVRAWYLCISDHMTLPF